MTPKKFEWVKFLQTCKKLIIYIWLYCKERFPSRLWRFGVVGVVATSAYYLLGLLLVYVLHLPVLIGNALAFALSFIASYLGQRKWTFQAKGSHKTMLLRFGMTQLFGLALNTIIVKICLTLRLSYKFAMLPPIVIIPIITYIICKFWVFKSTDKNLTENQALTDQTNPND